MIKWLICKKVDNDPPFCIRRKVRFIRIGFLAFYYTLHKKAPSCILVLGIHMPDGCAMKPRKQW